MKIAHRGGKDDYKIVDEIIISRFQAERKANLKVYNSSLILNSTRFVNMYQLKVKTIWHVNSVIKISVLYDSIKFLNILEQSVYHYFGLEKIT